MDYHIVQFNVARFRAPLDDRSMSAFVDALDPINALADSSPGFVWRLQTDSGNATDIRLYEDPLIAVNMSVWESLEALRAFVYSSEHKRYLARRAEWFSPMDELYLVLWWTQAGIIPAPEEGIRRLDRLRAVGPTVDAFTFRSTFPPPKDEAAEVGNRIV